MRVFEVFSPDGAHRSQRVDVEPQQQKQRYGEHDHRARRKARSCDSTPGAIEGVGGDHAGAAPRWRSQSGAANEANSFQYSAAITR